MSLTAHPYVVLAEQQWKQESLGGANRAPGHHPHDTARGRHGGGRSVLQRLGKALHARPSARQGRHTARPV